MRNFTLELSTKRYSTADQSLHNSIGMSPDMSWPLDVVAVAVAAADNAAGISINFEDARHK